MNKLFAGLAIATLTIVAAPLPSAHADDPPPLHVALTLDEAKEFEIKFPVPQHSPSNDREWVAITAADAPDTSFGTWKYVDDKATSVKLTAPTSKGKYQVRLHTHYPAKTTNLVYRVNVTVK